MFRGRYEHNIDGKGRLSLPSAFKKQLAQAGDDRLIVTTHLSSPCLVAYPPAEWEAFEGKLSKLPQFDPSVMLLRRLYVGGAMDCTIDKIGRVLVPGVLREHAKLTKEVYWVGGMKTLEIWAKPTWIEQIEGARQSVGPEVLSKLSELGI